jgi:hypothetical protein
MRPIPDTPRLIFFDQPGGIDELPRPVQWLQKHLTAPVTLYSHATVSNFFKVVAPLVPPVHLTYQSSNQRVEPLDVVEHSRILGGYLELLEDAAFHLRRNSELLAVVTSSYLQEYANHTYLSTTLSLKEKALLLERYRQEHLRILQGQTSLRILVDADEKSIHYFSRKGTQHRAAKELNVQDLFTHHESVSDYSQSGSYLSRKYNLPTV